MKKKIVTISDTHSLHNQVNIPDGDILLCAGDITNKGDLSDVTRFNYFLSGLPHKHKVSIAGNHDFCFEDGRKDHARKDLSVCEYLCDEWVNVDGLKIYGSPWQPWFYDWAFNLQRGQELKEKWAMIPDDTDILITHGPPMGILDYTLMDKKNVGCQDLLDRINEIKPKLHLFGHIHEGYGTDKIGETLFVNASTCTLRYQPINKPIVIIYDSDTGEFEVEPEEE